ncbi:MAG: hypothetical protein FWF82_06830, partial [Oscillospiraceae bacterium]|nr:hypothetical protein [Oscillospiraceae bacterium]
MKKKVLAMILAVAMTVSLITTVQASFYILKSPYRPPTVNSETGGWDVNDFRREGGFSNDVGISMFGEPVDYVPVPSLNVSLPVGADFAKIKYLRAEFNFPNGTDLDELETMAIVLNSNIYGWQQHSVHTSKTANCNPDARVVCGNDCKYDTSGAKPTVTVPVDLEDNGYDTCKFLKIAVICDWDSGNETPGFVNITLLDSDGKVIPLCEVEVPETVTTETSGTVETDVTFVSAKTTTQSTSKSATTPNPTPPITTVMTVVTTSPTPAVTYVPTMDYDIPAVTAITIDGTTSQQTTTTAPRQCPICKEIFLAYYVGQLCKNCESKTTTAATTSQVATTQPATTSQPATTTPTTTTSSHPTTTSQPTTTTSVTTTTQSTTTASTSYTIFAHFGIILNSNGGVFSNAGDGNKVELYHTMIEGLSGKYKLP